MADEASVLWFEQVSMEDVARVGGKNASLGELIQHLTDGGIRVPGGFATTAAAYRRFLAANELEPQLRAELAQVDRHDVLGLERVGARVRSLVAAGSFPEADAAAIRVAYRELCRRVGRDALAVAVRSSATAEDLPDASFAGQQETYLNVRGEADLLEACRRCYASLFTDRAIAYRLEHGFDHLQVALSVGVQQMVRSDLAGAGVMFSLDTETGFPELVLISANWGLGETVVGGEVDPDEYRVFKPPLDDSDKRPIIGKRRGEKERKRVYAETAAGAGATTREVETPEEERRQYVLEDDEILQLARWAVAIEEHYGRPMDIEWAQDGGSGELYVVQARPETVRSREATGRLRTYALQEEGEVLTRGQAIGAAIAAGEACRLESAAELGSFRDGAVLVTAMTDPDWVPIMKRAAAIVTDHGGRTSHAAIVSRELGIPAVVGTGDATRVIADGNPVTVSCAEGDAGLVYQGSLAFGVTEVDVDDLPEPPVPLMINVASPGGAMRWWRLPVAGVGLARMEFVIDHAIRIHPLALTRFDQVTDPEARRQIEELTAGYPDKGEYFVERLAWAIGTIAASRHPDPVVVRMSDFKTNEYAALIGGRGFEPAEENPMLGFRGCSRYYSDRYRDGFALECRAVKRVREELGLENIVVMIPFVRTVEEADRVLEVLAENGLRRGQDGLRIYMMAEIPANVFRARELARRFDGFSIGSNDLTQLMLGVDRDAEALGALFDERDEAVREAIRLLIARAHAEGTKVGICGQAPSDHPDFAAFLVEAGIDTISLNPDCVADVLQRFAAQREVLRV